MTHWIRKEFFPIPIVCNELNLNFLNWNPMLECERCGNKFSCLSELEKSGTEPCWCKAMPLLKPLPAVYMNCLCPDCLILFAKNGPITESSDLIEGEDFYLEKGLFVFTEKYHLKKGACCKNNCRHCPYR